MPCIIVPLYLSLCLVSLYGLRVSEILLGIVEWLPPSGTFSRFLDAICLIYRLPRSQRLLFSLSHGGGCGMDTI